MQVCVFLCVQNTYSRYFSTLMIQYAGVYYIFLFLFLGGRAFLCIISYLY